MADKKKHFYAVFKGRRPGIYQSWSGSGGAEEQVRGYAGAVYRGFATREEAEYFLRKGEAMPAPPSLALGDSAAPVSAPAQPADIRAEYQPDLDAGKVVIFTDGASTGNPGPGGYGVVLLFGSTRRELSGGFRCTTNNRMELTGVITALQALSRRSNVIIYSDSRYVINAVQKGWATRWRANGWMRNAEEQAENADLWARLLNLLAEHTVEFRWVKGHASNPENERCDRLAVQAAHQRGLPEDSGFAC